ncbi:PspC domain-containing protein [Tissierellaceae bacterium HCP3S3_D8]|jgi:phage shock protein C
MKRLTRSRNNKMISGVCGGIGEFFGVDPNLVRVAFVLLGLSTSTTSFIIIYIISTIIIPEDDGIIYQDEFTNTKDNSVLFMGIGLIILGIVLLVRIYLPIIDVRIIPSINIAIKKILSLGWPVLLIVLGIYMLVNQKNNK